MKSVHYSNKTMSSKKGSVKLSTQEEVYDEELGMIDTSRNNNNHDESESNSSNCMSPIHCSSRKVSPKKSSVKLTRVYADDVEVGISNTDTPRDSINNGSESRVRVVPYVIQRRFPFYVVSITIFTWIVFFYGVVFLIGWDKTVFTASTPLSPPDEAWWFMTVTWYPSCGDARHQYWRLLSLQFVHEGLMHIGGNSLASLGFGCMLESYQPYGFVLCALVYQFGVIFGALGHSYLWPFRGLVGCSPGVYGIIGACWAVVLTNWESMDPVIAFTLSGAVVIQTAMDIGMYMTSYSSSTGYASHAFGMFTGLTLGLTYAGLIKKQRWIKVLGVVAFGAFLMMAVFLLYHYLKVWPPEPFMRSYIHNNPAHVESSRSCCAQLFDFAESQGVSLSAAKETTYCSGDTLYPY